MKFTTYTSHAVEDVLISWTKKKKIFFLKYHIYICVYLLI